MLSSYLSLVMSYFQLAYRYPVLTKQWYDPFHIHVRPSAENSLARFRLSILMLL
jgi:hypothetical protein